MIGIIFIIGSVQSLFFAVLLLLKKHKNRADLFLTAFFLNMALYLLFAYSSNFEFYRSAPAIMPVIALIPLLYGPILYFYVYELVSPLKKKKHTGLHLIPIVTYFLVVSPVFFIENGMLKLFTDRFIDLPFYVNLGASIMYLSAPTYFVFILIMLRKHKRKIRDTFSYDDNINLNWLNYLVIGAIILWLPEIARIVYINYFSSTIPLPFSHTIKSCYVIFIFLMGFYGLRQGNIFTETDFPAGTDTGDRTTNGSRKEPLPVKKRKVHIEDNGDACKKKLLEYIADKKPYLDSDLKLLDIAVDLHIPPHILSYVINEKLNKNFFNLINSYRVASAREILVDPRYANNTILSIAFECGFNSKSSFNRIFKEQTGLTPSMYQKKNLQKT